MNLPCETIQDLIPLVQDGVASPSSVSLVQEHLAGCKSCTEFYYASIANAEIPTSKLRRYDEAVEREQVKAFGKKVRKRRAFTVALVALGIVILLVVQYLILTAGMFSLFTFNTKDYTTTDTALYGVYEGHIHGEAEELAMRTLLPLFPEELTDKQQVEDYYYFCSTLGISNQYQIYLAYTLSPQDFSKEVERLAEITSQYDTTNFSFPAYVIQLDTDSGKYEYALLDEANNRIICVLSHFKNINDIPMDESYLPNSAT